MDSREQCKGGASAIHGGRANDSRIYADGINMGWAGSSGGGGQMPQVAAAQEVVMTISEGLAEANERLVFNAVPREGANKFWPVQLQRRRTTRCKAVTTRSHSEPRACGPHLS